MPVVRTTHEGELVVSDFRWGLVPSWSKDIKIGAKAINARAETVAEKPMFREAFKRRRCLVPASGYFEWKVDEGGKQPYFIHSPDSPLLMFGGLWESWRENRDDREAEPLRTYTIVTGPPGVVSGDVHDRAPVILSAEQWSTWLSGETEAAAGILANAVEPKLTYYPVPKAVGSPKNDRPELVRPLEEGRPS
jgi:putative SOS response-associated peptidase YedK